VPSLQNTLPVRTFSSRLIFTISWDEIALPNGTSYELSNVVGADTSGHSGLEDKVNPRIGRAVAVTTVNAAVTGASGFWQRR